MADRVKLLVLCAAVLVLNSCNTAIGVGRDVKIGYDWTKGKIQGEPSGSGGENYDDQGFDYGAPVY